jgi:hypothetical protein
MRTFLPFALLFVGAAAVQAQEPVAQEPVERAATEASRTEAQATEGAPVPAREEPAPVADLKPRSEAASAIDAATLRAPVDVDETAQDITAPRNFWWLVGAIVLAGVILAVLL